MVWAVQRWADQQTEGCGPRCLTEYQPHTQALHLHPTVLKPGKPCLTLLYAQRKPQGFPTPLLVNTLPLACSQSSHHSGHCTCITSFDSANACEIWIID